ncbi:MFS transporter [Microbacterium paludicola]|uniref:MFS transporter n=1 Tax=Microbacterium paludicola TaxID=300019 RepID=A0A4Y9FX79_9MICO|nr:MFS transporter [Microbacterium paludicola]MBF0815569.1 MFS transporter [Microbacterium paludicola]TFU33830.1 MFS transporter [Microbacterium paludicola]
MSARDRRARRAVIGAFLVNGFLLATWVVNIPAIQQQSGVSHGVLGGLLLLLGLGSFVAMQATGWIVDRVGSRVATITGAAMLILATLTPPLATDPVTLAVAVFAIGLGNGTLDVAMNAHAVVVERRYQRPIMASFHAWFSVGGAIGAGFGALGHALGWDLPVLFLVAAAIAATAAAIALPGLLGDADISPATPHIDGPEGGPVPGLARRAILLGTLAFMLMLAEGVAADWSALHTREHLGASESTAALAYAAFAVAMTAGRFAADGVAARVGPVAIVRYGAAVAAVGLLVVTLSTAVPVALGGWILFGLGLSGAVPQIFTAAGGLGAANAGVVMSRIVGAGYVGLLAGPALIGWLAEGMTLSVAIAVPILLCGAAVALASSVAVPQPAQPVAA